MMPLRSLSEEISSPQSQSAFNQKSVDDDETKQREVALYEFFSSVGATMVRQYEGIIAGNWRGREAEFNRLLNLYYGVDLLSVGSFTPRPLCGPLVVYDFDETLTRATFVETGWGIPDEERYQGLVQWGGFDAQRLEQLRQHLVRIAKVATPVVLSFNGSWADPNANFDLRALLAHFGLLEYFVGVCGILDMEKRGLQNKSKAACIREMMSDPEGFFGRPHEGVIEHAILVDDDKRHCDLAHEAGLHAHHVQKFSLWPGHDPVGGIDQSDYYAVEAWAACWASKKKDVNTNLSTVAVVNKVESYSMSQTI